MEPAPRVEEARPEVQIGDLTDADPSVRLAAAKALAGGSATAAHVDPLAGALSDENRWVREWAARALTTLGATAAPAVPALHDALLDADSFVRFRAAEALAHIGAEAAAALPRLEAAAADTDETELGRYWAGEAARRIRGASTDGE